MVDTTRLGLFPLANSSGLNLSSRIYADLGAGEVALTLGQLLTYFSVNGSGAGSASNSDLSNWAFVQSFQFVGTITRDSNGAIVSGAISWPDGTSGVFTTDVASTAFPGAVDAWHATYAGTPSKTISQPAVTRDTNGAVILQPAITIA